MKNLNDNDSDSSETSQRSSKNLYPYNSKFKEENKAQNFVNPFNMKSSLVQKV